MTTLKQIEIGFLEKTKDFIMKIEYDFGFNRHIRFRHPSSSFYWFDIITWDGSLVINGEYGTWVFSRLPDMFCFFRIDPGDFNYNREGMSINPDYWAEKLKACDRGSSSATEFSHKLFEQNIKKEFDEYEFETEDLAVDCWKEIEEEVLCYSDNQHEAMTAANNFSHKSGFNLENFWEVDSHDFRIEYIWCLYAIVWGIQQYDEFKSAEKEVFRGY